MGKAEEKDKADAPTAKAASAGKVLYKGLSHVRVITREDWKAVGIDHDTVQWDAQNLFMVPLDQIKLDEQQFDAYIKGDPDFVIIDGDRDKLPKSHPHLNRFNPEEPYTEGIAGGGGGSSGTSGAPAGGGVGGSTGGDAGGSTGS